MHRFANPTRFLGIARAVLPWTSAGAALTLALGLYLALVASPVDYQQHDSVRIMYVHVPAAWMALMTYAAMAAASFGFLVWRHPLADVAARSAAPIGATFTAICLATGSLWGKPTWGAWWVWDARLTSVLILFFLYLGYMAVTESFEDRGRGARAAAIVALVGAINLPIIKFSVDWWHTLHQPASVLRLGGPTIDPALLTPLMVMALAYLLIFVSLLLVRMRGEMAAQRVEAASLMRAGAVPA